MAEVHEWWPHLSIAAKQEVLLALRAPLSEGVRREIAALTGEASPTELSEREVDFIVTQGEAVD